MTEFYLGVLVPAHSTIVVLPKKGVSPSRMESISNNLRYCFINNLKLDRVTNILPVELLTGKSRPLRRSKTASKHDHEPARKALQRRFHPFGSNLFCADLGVCPRRGRQHLA